VSRDLPVGLRSSRSRRPDVPPPAIFVIAVATLLIVLGVMTGKEHALRDAILGFNPHITVTSFNGPLAEWKDVVARVRQVDGVLAAGPVAYGRATIARGRSASGVVVRAIDPSAGAVVDVGHHMLRGSLDALSRPQQITLPSEEGGGRVELGPLLIGKELARQLGVTLGDTVGVTGAAGPAGMVPRIERFVVAGIFDSGMDDYDTTLAYMALADAQKLFDLREEVSALEVRVADVDAASGIARRLERTLGGFPYRARDWTEASRNLLSASELQTVVAGILLCLVIAAFARPESRA
jgi:lipoprotein-releasing system permease protein